jgi:RHS repeat-associated protein
VTDGTGAKYAINTYDEYGNPVFSGSQSTNTGRFQYTGQAWLNELNLYYYKTRFYSPGLGRFLQTDPIGYKDQINLYEYVGDDPVDGVDETGALQCPNNQCPAIKIALDQIAQARNNLIRDGPPIGTRINAAANALGSVMNALGGINDGRGPKVSIDNSIDDQGAYEAGEIKLNEIATRAAGNTLGGTLAHEGTHYLEDLRGLAVDDFRLRMKIEYPAMVNGALVDIGLRRTGELYRVGENSDQVRLRIKAKLRDYCGVHGPMCDDFIDNQIPGLRGIK